MENCKYFDILSSKVHNIIRTFKESGDISVLGGMVVIYGLEQITEVLCGQTEQNL